ncbi:MAG: PP2C family protein-serine/threonine phosphatase [Candidatus Cyclobacteriaceae bacterium M3_2C_046]
MKVRQFNVCGSTNPGRVREHNEDNILILGQGIRESREGYLGQKIQTGSKGLLFMVADGMGGANAGEVASELAKSTVQEHFQQLEKAGSNPANLLKKIIQSIHKTIREQARHSITYKGMGTTIVIGWIIQDLLHVAWVGDSRCYILEPDHEGDFFPFTDDHSLVWNMVKAGELSAEQARTHEQSNIILQSLGGDLDKPEPDYKSYQLKKGCRILLCSDGLNGMLSDQGIQQILLFEKDTCNACQKLIQAANNAGGKDNISVLVVDVLDQITPIEKVVPPPKKSRKKGPLKWLFVIFILSFLFMIFYLIDQGSLTGNKSVPINQDSTSQSSASMALAPSRERNSKENLSKQVAGSKNKQEKIVNQRQKMDSLKSLANEIKNKLIQLEDALNGGIKEVDNLKYTKIRFELQNLKEQMKQDSLAHFKADGENFNNLIRTNQYVLVKLDSLDTEISKANKLTKIKAMQNEESF